MTIDELLARARRRLDRVTVGEAIAYRGRCSEKSRPAPDDSRARGRDCGEDGTNLEKKDDVTRSRPLIFAGAALIAAVLALAGCGGSSSNSTNASAPAPKANGTTTIALAGTGLGNVLVDSQGRTVYLFQGDKGTTSECNGACASAWPPVKASSKPTVGTGLKASLVGTTKRSDGTQQVTYAGHPLYLYSGDSNPGDTNGQGLNAFGAPWYAVTASGAKASGSASNSGGGSVY
jgi:predicted lipoprotein with Yx(FWY)xxD motif